MDAHLMLSLTAKLFRQKIGSDLENTAEKVVKTLSAGRIPSTVIGGYALQEHGYHRNTIDIDLLVPSVEDAWGQLSIRGFRPTGSKSILYDRDNGVEINLLEQGGQATVNSPLPLPRVTHEPTEKPYIIPMDELIEMKLNVYVGNTLKYAKHGADVAELIRIHDLPEDFLHSQNQEIQDAWSAFWGAVQD